MSADKPKEKPGKQRGVLLGPPEGVALIPQAHGGALRRGGSTRPKGVPNKATTSFRETVTRLLHANEHTIARWVKECAEGRPAKYDAAGNCLQPAVPANPAAGLKAIASLAEYAAPRLSRQETVGDGGGPLTVVVRKEA